MRTQEEVVHAFRPVGKLNDTQQVRLLKIQKAFEDLATDIIDLAPDCPDRTSGLRKLLDSKFTVIQAVTHHMEKPAEKVVQDVEEKKSKKSSNAKNS